MTLATRRAVLADAPAILPLSAELFAHEHLAFDEAHVRGALDRLIADASLGFAIVADDPAAAQPRALAGYALCTFGYDLEFAGRDAWITEVLVAAAWRGQGVGGLLLDAVEREAAAHDVKALHLQVRPENEPARALYDARGYAEVPRLILSKRL